MKSIQYLDEAAVQSALNWDDLIAAMETALSSYSAGNVIQALRNWLTIEEGQRYLAAMPAVMQEAMGLKVVSFYPRNADTGTPTVMAMVLLLNPETGEPIAILDAQALTAMRTAAVSAAVTERLALPESRILALLGSGREAESHLAAIRHIRPIEEVRVWSRTPAHAERFAAKHGAIAMDAESAVRGADIIVTATPARSPILMGEWLKPGCHVNAIGSPMPTWRELDDIAMANTLVVECRDAVMHESGDVILSGAHIAAEAGELFAGLKSISNTETTIFKSVGMAVEDVAAAKLVFDTITKCR